MDPSIRRSGRPATINRPNAKLQLGIKARRTTEEVAADRETARELEEQQVAAAQTKAQETQKRLGEIEDGLQREANKRKKDANRPDLRDKVSRIARISKSQPGTHTHPHLRRLFSS